MNCTAPVPEPPRLPRRLRGTPTTSRLMVGSDPGDVAVARRWAAQVTHAGVRLARDVTTVVSELVTNSHRHTASGLPGGTTLIEIERLRFQLVVRVTDDGPRPGEPHPSFPRMRDPEPLAVGGYGLRIVDTLALYWDWEGDAGGPLTVRALLEH
ncbi:ATP-binding protein [Nocardiopsis sp. FIRDI 009]|uniref:ATP-binding protein n=1 Tax=Nocardiopsis sp. FIRDI 009 TaxID=714197 RepID=UPI000E286A33|nr:ATP-binding protein [Nocardiopsis sp. FIRDI 009]